MQAKNSPRTHFFGLGPQLIQFARGFGLSFSALEAGEPRESAKSPLWPAKFDKKSAAAPKTYTISTVFWRGLAGANKNPAPLGGRADRSNADGSGKAPLSTSARPAQPLTPGNAGPG